jgi:hypothetical protein
METCWTQVGGREARVGRESCRAVAVLCCSSAGGREGRVGMENGKGVAVRCWASAGGGQGRVVTLLLATGLQSITLSSVAPACAGLRWPGSLEVGFGLLDSVGLMNWKAATF